STQFTIKLAVNSSGVSSGINAAVGQFERLYGTATKVVQGFLGLAAVRWGANIIKSSIELGSHLTDMALRSKMNVEEMQSLAHGFDQAGGSLEGMMLGMKKLAN